MERHLKISCLALCVVAVATLSFGCTPSKSASNATIAIQAPSNSAHLLSAIPSGRTACYGISISGTGIPASQANSCSPHMGMISGYVASGQTLNASVTSGATINIDLYLFLMPAGSVAACPLLSPAFSPSQLLDTYLIGSAQNVTVTAPTTNVTIVASFPTISQNIAQQLSMPASCTVSSQPASVASPYTASAGQATLSGADHKVTARVGLPTSATTLVGSSHAIIVR